MTPTDEIKARLNELGVEYTFDDSNDCEIVEWQGPYNLWWQFVYDPYEEEPYGELRLMETGGATHLTPEQAIAATVGAETCEWCKDGKTFDKQTAMVTNHGWQEIRHCPNCGRRLVSE